MILSTLSFIVVPPQLLISSRTLEILIPFLLVVEKIYYFIFVVCFFNAGLYRSTGYNMEDTWPDTIFAASNLQVPIVVTAYTEYESPLDMTRFSEVCQRKLRLVQSPSENPFASVKPERNFISDDEAPLMFKNYYCFVVE